jgi:type 2 lantibiotic biosynthesis protein LanM
MTTEDLIAIVEKSAFFYERLNGGFSPAPLDAKSDAAVASRMEQWRISTGSDDIHGFQRRLEWDRLNETTARALASRVRVNDSNHLPAWAETLMRVAGTAIDESAHGFLKDDEYPFQELLVPFVVDASARVHAAAGSALSGLTESARVTLERYLLRSLSRMSAETLGQDFEVYVAVQRALRQRPDPWSGRTRYLGFLQQMANGGWTVFLGQYPVLARLMASVSDQWVESVTEFARRLQADWPAIARNFGAGEDPGRLVWLEPGISDRHAGGRTSYHLKFESGLECIYKPKDLAAEQMWYGLLEWINDRGMELPFRIFKTLAGDGYGWVEMVRHVPCRGEDEVRRYYRRAGNLLALLLVFEGSDCHHENLIAHGEYPVLIDMETLFTHRVRGIDGEESASQQVGRMFYWDSVFRTALLPRWEFGPRGQSFDISALGGVDNQQSNVRDIVWENVNTDQMRMRRTFGPAKKRKNTVYLGDEVVDPGRYVDEIVAGFESLYGFLQQHAEELLSPGGPLDKAADLPLRFLYRNTKIYSTLSRGLFQPRNLSDGMDASVHADNLSRPLLGTAERHPYWDLLAAEHEALLRGDVPLFTSRAGSSDIDIGGGWKIANFFERPSLDLVRDNLRQLSSDGMRLQASFIRASFPIAAKGVPGSSIAALQPEVQDEPRREEFLNEALRIAERIREVAVRSSDGSAAWITVAYYPEAHRWQLQPMGPRLYDGECGVALFLAAAESISGGAGLRPLAMAALGTITGFIDDPKFHRWLFEPGLGAGTGGSSVIYALTRCAQFLGEDGLLDPAHRAAALITSERIGEDRKLDLISGVAGALLSLLALHSVSAKESVLQSAIECGEHLLDNRTAASNGLRSWRTLDGELQPGFSHGAAGIAYALLRLAKATGDSRYRDAASEAIAWEDSLFLPELGTWPDYPGRKNGKTNGVEYCSWCHGAPGIGLARIGGAGILRSPEVERDIQAALKTLLADPLSPLDHVCCGNMGKAEVLLTAAGLLGLPEYEREALKLANRVMLRARHSGNYQLGWDAGTYIPSFHQGVAGIGYELLRLARPHQAPCVLLWE